jgi:hypothetical protein
MGERTECTAAADRRSAHAAPLRAPGRPHAHPTPSAAPDGPSAARCVSILAETAGDAAREAGR